MFVFSLCACYLFFLRSTYAGVAMDDSDEDADLEKMDMGRQGGKCVSFFSCSFVVIASLLCTTISFFVLCRVLFVVCVDDGLCMYIRLHRWDFETEEEWSEYNAKREAIPKFVFCILSRVL